jgi:transposase
MHVQFLLFWALFLLIPEQIPNVQALQSVVDLAVWKRCYQAKLPIGREGRRLRAWELHQKGWKQQAIAEALGVTQGAVSQWLKRVKEGGVEGLRHRPPPGAAPRLSPEQRAQLLELLSQGAEALGFQGDVWTQPRVATLIRDRLGVSYDPSQVGRILKASGWSRQKPVHRAT